MRVPADFTDGTKQDLRKSAFICVFCEKEMHDYQPFVKFSLMFADKKKDFRRNEMNCFKPFLRFQ